MNEYLSCSFCEVLESPIKYKTLQCFKLQTLQCTAALEQCNVGSMMLHQSLKGKLCTPYAPYGSFPRIVSIHPSCVALYLPTTNLPTFILIII